MAKQLMRRLAVKPKPWIEVAPSLLGFPLRPSNSPSLETIREEKAEEHEDESDGGHINPAVTFGLFLGRKVSLIRALLYMVAQCLGAICGCGLVKAFQKAYYTRYGGGANELSSGYSKGTGLGAEIIGTFVLVYTVFSATDPKRNARDSHVPWIFWVGPFIGAAIAAFYHQYILRAAAIKALGSFRSNA
ncbi:hypothetical protein GH714_002565 [Hevea brasiliensis]|uniref:Aquaporin n=1 Tax=Hevea brasiliensis TaxID=3981 RepID=A0A6A6N8V5_HEVBR|nr:hypothetical protein GH714_002565 [Hevea brasiliensis]